MSEIFPEKGGDIPVSVLGMDLSAGLPRGAIPVSAVVVVRCLMPENEEHGHDMLWWAATGGLASWEISGMCNFVQHGIKSDWTDAMFGNDGEEDPRA